MKPTEPTKASVQPEAATERSGWLDGHLDLAYIALAGRELSAEEAPADSGCVTLPALRRANVTTVFATIFTEPTADGAEPWAYRGPDDVDGAEAAGRLQLEVYQRLAAQGELRLVETEGDLANDGLNAILLMEGADPLRGPEAVADWHRDGLRIVGLTWSAGTRYAGGNTRPGPITHAGRELVDALDAVGMIHDASHLADEALEDLLERAEGPIVATHSNCRALTGPSQRHLRDDQIREIGRRGGVIGLNLFSPFLTSADRATIDDCVAHVCRVGELMGHRAGVALGSDMDGGFGPDRLPRELEHPAHLERLAAALRAAGWSDDEIEGFRWRNWTELLRRAWAPTPNP